MSFRSASVSWLLLLVVLLLPAAGQAAFPGENGPIVFDGYPADGDLRQIYSVEPDGSDFRRLTDPAAGRDNSDPAIGPNSKEITYSAFDERLPEGIHPLQLRALNLDGTGDSRVTTGVEPNSMASYLPEDSGLIFVHNRGGADESMFRYGFNKSFYRVPIEDCCFYGPTVSPQVTAAVWIDDDEGIKGEFLSGGATDIVAPEALTGYGRPTWAPNGERIAFVSGPVMAGDDVVIPAGIHSIYLGAERDRRLEVAATAEGFPASPAYSPDGTSLAYVVPEGDPGIHVKNLTSGGTRVIDPPPTGISTIDWGNRVPVVDPPPSECRMRFTKARLFVFKKKPVYRLVARYWSADPGVVAMRFYERKADGKRGRLYGTIIKQFDGAGRFRMEKRVGRKTARKLRRAEHGFITEFEIAGQPDLCEVSASLNLTRLERVKGQYVWFTR